MGAVEAQRYSFKYSCGTDKGRKWNLSPMKSQGSRFLRWIMKVIAEENEEEEEEEEEDVTRNTS